MYFFSLGITVLAALSGLEWLARNLLAFPVWRRAFHLDDNYPSNDSAASVFVSVVIACKDEELNIEYCAKDILTQDHENFELILIDDRSADNTREIIKKIASEDNRVRTVFIDKLPDGWCGKNHAMQKGIDIAKSNWLIMSDADCKWYNPKLISKAISYTFDENADMVTLLPTLKMRSFWEKLLLPVCGGILMIWFPPKKVNNPRKKQAFANGQFMLISKKAYTNIGEHEAIKGSLIEDIDFARNIKRNSLTLRFAPTRNMFSVRMYSNLADIIRGWVRIFIGAFQTFGGLLSALGVLIGRGATPMVTCLLCVIMCLTNQECHSIWFIGSIVSSMALGLQLLMMTRFYHHTGAPAVMGMIYHFTILIVSYIICKTIGKLLPGSSIKWRDTVYDSSKHAGKYTLFYAMLCNV